MALEARVKDSYRWSSIVALDGVEFIKSEWRPVPITREDEAERTAQLEIREIPEAKIKISTPVGDPDASTDAEAKGIADFVGRSAKLVIADVEISESVELLEAGYEAEANGKKRVTVLRAITARLGELDSGGE